MARGWAAVIASVVLAAGLAAPVSASGSPAVPAAGGSISCVTPTWCVDAANGTSGAQLQLWDGTSFTVMPQPSTFGVVLAVACVSTAMCMGVGMILGAVGSQLSFSELWNGSQWSPLSTPDIGPVTAVACPSAVDCLAVGQSGSLAWNGAGWQASMVPGLAATLARGLERVRLVGGRELTDRGA